MIASRHSSSLRTRLRRLIGAAGLACVVVASAAPSDAFAAVIGRAKPKAVATAKRGTGAQQPKQGGAKLTARERARARSVAAASRTRASDHRVAVREEAKSKHVASLSAAARATRIRDSVVAMARAQIGVPYVLGGTSPSDGFDCSGLVKYVMAALHVQLPRTAAEQAAVGKRVAKDPSRLRPGDLLTFAEKGEGVSHIGIYVGNGRMVHASTTAGQVIETKLIRPPYPTIKPWRGARRVVAVADVPSSDKH